MNMYVAKAGGCTQLLNVEMFPILVYLQFADNDIYAVGWSFERHTQIALSLPKGEGLWESYYYYYTRTPQIPTWLHPHKESWKEFTLICTIYKYLVA